MAYLMQSKKKIVHNLTLYCCLFIYFQILGSVSVYELPLLKNVKNFARLDESSRCILFSRFNTKVSNINT